MRCGASGIDSSLRTLFGLGALGGLEDARLLELFVEHSGAEAELAFSVLVERHGPMVQATCRGVLGDGPDAEDAFLVLAKRAESIGQRQSVAAWLHGVARRVARKARRQASRRQDRERRAAETRTIERWDRPPDDLNNVLHKELGRLPESYRAPIVLCYLEGLTHEQAADRLGWPVGTVRGRMARGRELLRARLTRRGLAPTTCTVMTALTARRAVAALPKSLIVSTTRAAAEYAAGSARLAGVVPARVAALSQGVLTVMRWNTIGKTLFVLIPTAALIVGVGGVSARQGGDAPGPSRDTEPPQVAEVPVPKQDTEQRPAAAEPEADEKPHARLVPLVDQELLKELSAYPIPDPGGRDWLQEAQNVDDLLKRYERQTITSINVMLEETRQERDAVAEAMAAYIDAFKKLRFRRDALKTAIDNTVPASAIVNQLADDKSSGEYFQEKMNRLGEEYLEGYTGSVNEIGSVIRGLAVQNQALILSIRRLEALKEAMSDPLDGASDMSSRLEVQGEAAENQTLDMNVRRSSTGAAPIDPRDRRLDELERKVDAILEALQQESNR